MIVLRILVLVLCWAIIVPVYFIAVIISEYTGYVIDRTEEFYKQLKFKW